MHECRACLRVPRPFGTVHVRTALVAEVVTENRDPLVPLGPDAVAFSPRESHGEWVPQKLVDAEEERFCSDVHISQTIRNSGNVPKTACRISRCAFRTTDTAHAFCLPCKPVCRSTRRPSRWSPSLLLRQPCVENIPERADEERQRSDQKTDVWSPLHHSSAMLVVAGAAGASRAAMNSGTVNSRGEGHGTCSSFQIALSFPPGFRISASTLRS